MHRLVQDDLCTGFSFGFLGRDEINVLAVGLPVVAPAALGYGLSWRSGIRAFHYPKERRLVQSIRKLFLLRMAFFNELC